MGYLAALVAPGALTLMLVGVSFDNPRDYAFLYLCIVAVLGVAIGVGPSLVAAALSTVLVDYLFVPPKHTLSIGNTEDVVNLLVFFGAAGLVGTLGSLRRNAQLRSQALANELQRANLDLARLNREQAEAAQVAAQLAERERQVSLLEETDRVRHEFFANVSHELRTPLGGILTGATAVLQRHDLEPSLREELDDVAAAAQRLARLVSDMLDVARIQGGAVDLQIDRVDIADAIEAAVNRLRRASPGRRVTVCVAPDTPEVVADWESLGQVIDNLLANADHHAPAGHNDHRLRRCRGGERVVRVVDAGPGVPSELAGRIFERFVRGTGGTGLGCRSSAGSSPPRAAGSGSRRQARRGRTFRDLPAACMTEAARILLAEDDRALRQSIAAALRGGGFAVDAVPDGIQAAQLLREEAYDVVLLDIGLPFVDGWEILQQIEGRRQPSVIVISARGEERDKVRALDLGADDYLTKPFGADELLARLRAVLQTRAHRRQRGHRARRRSHRRPQQPVRHAAQQRFASPPPNGCCSPSSRLIPAPRSTTVHSSDACGGPPTSATATTCGPSSSACAESWRKTLPIQS